MSTPVYATVDDIRDSLDLTDPALTDALILTALEAATDAITGLTKRTFYPEVGTKYFDWPTLQTAEPWRVWLEPRVLYAITGLTAGGVTIPTTDCILEPNYSGPPYTSLQVSLATSSALQAGTTWQQAIAVTGTWGHLTSPATALTTVATGGITDTATTLTVTGSGGAVGHILQIGSEIMTVTSRSSTATTATLTTGATASSADTLLAVSSTSGLTVGEKITIGSERMRITDITTGLVVQRAVEGTVLAAHAIGAALYAGRTLTVARGACGSTAAAHLAGAAVTRWDVPGIVRSYALAHTLATLQSRKAGYIATTVQAGANTSRAGAEALGALGQQLVSAWGRQARTRVV